MKNMEIMHNKCKEELQELYEKKLEYEKKEFANLRVRQEEMRKYKQREIQNLHRDQEQHIEQLLNEFKTLLQKMQEDYEKQKRQGDSLKMKNEEKLTSQEADQTAEILTNKQLYEKEIEKLEKVISELKSNLVTLKWQTAQFQTEEQ